MLKSKLFWKVIKVLVVLLIVRFPLNFAINILFTTALSETIIDSGLDLLLSLIPVFCEQ